MSAGQSNYYEILGLSPAATPEEIKKKYRELARRYHPDINPSPDAAQKIKVINEAYHILGDSDRRVVYDAERLLRQNAAAPKPPPPSSASPSNPPRPANGSRPYPSNGRAEYNGFGRTAPEPPPFSSRANSSRPPTSKGAPRPSTSRPARETFGAAESLVAEARLAFINHRYREAETFCQQALMADRRNAVAHEILGDIYMKRGKRDSAATSYSYSIQFNPRNLSVQAKLDRLHHVAPDKAPTRPLSTHTMPSQGWQPYLRGSYREANYTSLSVALVISFLGMLWALSEHSGAPRASFLNALPFVSELTFNLFAVTIFNGVVAGILLAFYGGMRPISEELLNRSATSGKTRVPVSLGTLLTLFSLVWFYVSLLAYVAIGIRQDRVSPSVMRVYGVCILLIALFALLYKPFHPTSTAYTIQALVFGGNLLFPAMLFGWTIGDAIRLRGR